MRNAKNLYIHIKRITKNFVRVHAQNVLSRTYVRTNTHKHIHSLMHTKIMLPLQHLENLIPNRAKYLLNRTVRL